MTMTKREKILICIVLVLAVLFVYYMYFFQPCMNELNELNNQKSSKESTLSAYQQIESRIEEIDKNIEGYKNDITQMSGNIMPRLDQPAVLVYLNDTIGDYDAEKIMYDFEEVAEIGQLKVCQVKVTMNCTYEILKKILKSLEEGEYFSKVVGIEAGWSSSEGIMVGDDSNVPITPQEPQEPQEPGDTENPEDTENPAGPENPGDTESPAGPQTPVITLPESTPSFIDEVIAVAITLEFYNLDGEIPADKSYPFSDGHFYGGDIFF